MPNDCCLVFGNVLISVLVAELYFNMKQGEMLEKI